MAASPHVQPSLLAADHAPPSLPEPRASVRELEHRYPGLWRAGQLGRAGRLPVCPTGYDALTAELPGGGWPAGAVSELLLAQEGAGELRLLMPALRTLAASGRRIGLVNPPYLPNGAGLAPGLPARLLYWVRPTAAATIASQRTDMLWAAEQMLRSQAFGAMLVWLAGARPEALRRLQVLAQAGDTVVWVLRPMRVLHESSAAVLRLALAPEPGNQMSIVFHKRRGPVRDTPLLLPLEGMAHVPQRTGVPAVAPVSAASSAVPSHVADDVLDRGAPAAPAAGRAAAELA
ncbi:translesion DNA synthesis-associated protein ImuA [Cupriavidus agavae]|uniref:Protein ImuA n=1 Tax=Cupriavidus agavae TaxID=1001822 RepID=A0A4V2FGD7_9BURK|nr:translesion DNA synthesis-associated protein ImuA [Cupriavidus agavae]RZT36419.1 protein ImuA [Cupriavidus agavae]